MLCKATLLCETKSAVRKYVVRTDKDATPKIGAVASCQLPTDITLQSTN